MKKTRRSTGKEMPKRGFDARFGMTREEMRKPIREAPESEALKAFLKRKREEAKEK